MGLRPRPRRAPVGRVSNRECTPRDRRGPGPGVPVGGVSRETGTDESPDAHSCTLSSPSSSSSPSPSAPAPGGAGHAAAQRHLADRGQRRGRAGAEGLPRDRGRARPRPQRDAGLPGRGRLRQPGARRPTRSPRSSCRSRRASRRPGVSRQKRNYFWYRRTFTAPARKAVGDAARQQGPVRHRGLAEREEGRRVPRLLLGGRLRPDAGAEVGGRERAARPRRRAPRRPARDATRREPTSRS